MHGWSHTNVVGRDVVLRASRRNLPGLALRKSRLQVSEPAIDLGIGPLAFDKKLWSPALDDDEVDFSTIRVSEVPELEVTPLGILLVVNPFQEVLRHEVLESK